MKKFIVLSLVILAGILFFHPTASALLGQNDSQQSPWLKNTAPFQAEVETTIVENNGRRTINQSKYFFIPDKIRTEDLKEKNVFIMDMAKKVSYMFSKQNNSWMKFAMNDNLKSTAGSNMPEFKTQKLPDALVDGKLCAVTQYTFDTPRMKSTSTVYIWKDKNIPLKIAGEASGTKSEIVYKNIVFTKTPDSFFQPPAGAPVQDMSQFMNMPKQGK